MDARVIAGFGATLQPPPCEVADETALKIRAMTVRKRQLKGIRTAEKNRTEHSRDDFVEKSILTVIAAIETQICEIEEQIRILIASSSELKQESRYYPIFQRYRGKHRSRTDKRTAGDRVSEQKTDRIPDRYGAGKPGQRTVPGETHDRKGPM